MLHQKEGDKVPPMRAGSKKTETKEHDGSSRGGRHKTSLPLLIIVVMLAAMIPVVLFRKISMFAALVDIKPPDIRSLEQYPRGLGVSPVKFSFWIGDAGAGIGEVAVSVEQADLSREVWKRSLDGSRQNSFDVDISPLSLGLKDGDARVVVRAEDLSRWRSATKLVIPLKVDLEKPQLQLTQSEAEAMKEGSSHLLFYTATDSEPVITGIKIEAEFFPALLASQMDSEIRGTSIYACLFGIPVGSKGSVRLTAEDLVGNTAFAILGHGITRREGRTVQKNLGNDYLQSRILPLLNASLTQIARADEKSALGPASAEDIPAILRLFAVFAEKVRPLNAQDLLLRTGSRLYERFWNGEFLRPTGEVKASLGDRVVYSLNGREAFSYVETGYEVEMSWSGRDVIAANEGIVASAGEFGWYGKAVAVDHGFGLVSIYGNLEKIGVIPGEHVRKGQSIGLVGASGALPQNTLLFEMRIRGVPVDAESWWSAAWYAAEISRQTENVKRSNVSGSGGSR